MLDLNINIIKNLEYPIWYIVCKGGIMTKQLDYKTAINSKIINGVKALNKNSKDEIFLLDAFILRDKLMFINPKGSGRKLTKYSYVWDTNEARKVLAPYFISIKGENNLSKGITVKLLAEENTTANTAIAEIEFKYHI